MIAALLAYLRDGWTIESVQSFSEGTSFEKLYWRLTAPNAKDIFVAIPDGWVKQHVEGR